MAYGTALYSYGPYKTCIGASALFSLQIEYWILTCKVLYPMPAISAYSATFPPSSAAIWRSVANHLTVGKVRIIFRINIRILPVLTSKHPHIHTSAFYPLPLSAPQFLVQSVVSRVAYRCFHFDDVTGQRQYYITITSKYQVDNLDSYYWRKLRQNMFSPTVKFLNVCMEAPLCQQVFHFHSAKEYLKNNYVREIDIT